MTNQRFHAGAFVFTRARGITPRTPEDLPPLATAHGIPTEFIPTYAGDRTAIGRAMTQASSGLQREGVLLRPIRRTSTELIYGIVREQKDEAEQRLDHEFEATVSWSAEPDAGVVHGDHAIARRVADAYHELRGKIVADDWSGVITTYLERHDAARVRGDGRVYWVPPQRVEDVRRLGAGERLELGSDVVVVGGGNAAIDVARVCKRLGAATTVLYDWHIGVCRGDGRRASGVGTVADKVVIAVAIVALAFVVFVAVLLGWSGVG